MKSVHLDFQISLPKFPYGHETTLNLCPKWTIKCIQTVLFQMIYEYFRENIIDKVSTLTRNWYQEGKLLVQAKIGEWEGKTISSFFLSRERN